MGVYKRTFGYGNTTEPGVQLYTANHTNTTGKGGHTYKPRSALCLETQRYPDSPNKPAFPSAVLRPGDRFEVLRHAGVQVDDAPGPRPEHQRRRRTELDP